MVAGIEKHDIDGLTSDYLRSERQGLNVWQIQGEGLDVGDCENLTASPAIRHAGAPLSSSEVRLAPGTRTVQHVVATPGYLQVAWPDVEPSAVVVAGVDLARERGLVEHAELQVLRPPFRETLVRIGFVPSMEGRFEALDGALVTAGVAVGSTSTCVIEAARGYRTVARDIAVAGLSSRPESKVESAYPVARVEATDLNTEFRQRTTRNLWLPATASLALMLVSLWTARSREFAVYQLNGLSKAGLWIVLAADMALLSALPFAAGWTMAWTRGPEPGLGVAAEIATWDLLSVLAGLWIVTTIATAVVALRNPLKVIRAG